MVKEAKRKRVAIPYGNWATGRLYRPSIPGIILPDTLKSEATGKEEIEILMVGPDCKQLKPGHVVRPFGALGFLEVDGEKFYMINEQQVGAHLGYADEDKEKP